MEVLTPFAILPNVTVFQEGVPLLFDPASKGFSMVCELLLENGVDPLAETNAGVSPLYAASRNGHRDVVKILLKFGADATRVCAKVVQVVSVSQLAELHNCKKQ